MYIYIQHGTLYVLFKVLKQAAGIVGISMSVYVSVSVSFCVCILYYKYYHI
jgi:hypothetical protein